MVRHPVPIPSQTTRTLLTTRQSVKSTLAASATPVGATASMETHIITTLFTTAGFFFLRYARNRSLSRGDFSQDEESPLAHGIHFAFTQRLTWSRYFRLGD